MATNPLQMIPIAYVPDSQLPEGRVVIPFTLDFTNKTSIVVDLSSLQGNRKLSCMKGLIYSWQGLDIMDALQVTVQGSNQVYTISANANSLIAPDSLIAMGQIPMFSGNPVILTFKKTSGNQGGTGQFSITNFEVQPLAVNAVSSNQTFVNSFNGRFGIVIPEEEDYAEFYAGIGSGVTEFNGRTGAVEPAGEDYAAFYAPINSGVLEFNGRTGNVVPAGGDYAAFYAPINSGVTKFNGRTGNVVPASGDYSVAEVTGAAPIASPIFTGVVSTPLLTVNGNVGQSAFVDIPSTGLRITPATDTTAAYFYGTNAADNAINWRFDNNGDLTTNSLRSNSTLNVATTATIAGALAAASVAANGEVSGTFAEFIGGGGSEFAYGTYTDPLPGLQCDAKFGGSSLGIAVNGGSYFNGTLSVVGNSTFNGNVSAITFTVGASGVEILTGSGVPTGSKQVGSIYINTSGASGSTLYVYTGSAWHAFA